MGKDWIKQLKWVLRLVWMLMIIVVVLFIGVWLVMKNPVFLKFSENESIAKKEEPLETLMVEDQIKGGIHLPTGLVAGEGLEVVINNCTNCHTADLIIQNRGTRGKWRELIRWMQETQGLWDLGVNETIILDYLAENYSPEQKGRRAPLVGIEWYELKE